MRPIDVDKGWINRKFAQLEKMIREDRAAKRLAASTVGSNGELSVLGLLKVLGLLDLTGQMEMKSADGNLLIRMGDMPLGDRGLQLFREDGSTVLQMLKRFIPENPQSWALFDAAGHEIVSEAELLQGLSRPMLEHPFQPFSATPGTAVTCGPFGWERTTSSTSWETLFVYDGKRQNPLLDLKAAAFCSDGTTAGEIQAVDQDTGVQLDGWLAPPWTGVIPTGTTTYTVIDPAPNVVNTSSEFGVGDYMRVGVQVRRTAGAGSITLAVPSAIGG